MRFPRPLVGFAAAALLLALVALVVAPPNQLDAYDQDYALLWGSQLAHGMLPDYQTPAASTMHPLTVVVGAVLSPLGRNGAREALGFLNLLAWGVAVVAIGAVFDALLGVAAGVLAALAVIANAQLFDLVGAASADAFYIALLLTALAVEARTPRRRLPLVLLALAGLTRPEAWLLAGAYFIWRLPRTTARERVLDALIVVAAPALWIASDAIVTGNALFSLHHTQGAAVGFGPTGLASVPSHLHGAASLLVDLPEVAGAAVCAALLWRLRVRRALVPAAVVLLAVLGFIALGVAELPMLPRFLVVPAALATGAAGAALAGWMRVRGRARLAFGAAALLVLALAATHVPSQRDTWRGLQDAQLERQHRYADLRATLAHVPPNRCTYVVSYRYKSVVAYEAGVAPDRVHLLQSSAESGLTVVPSQPNPSFDYGVRIPAGLRSDRTVAAGSIWRVVDAGCRP